MRLIASILVFVLSVATYSYILPKCERDYKKRDVLYTFPPQFLRIVSLEFKGVVADLYFLNSLVFLGESSKDMTEMAGSKEKAYEYIYDNLANSLVLDKYFLDPYNLMNSSLIWDRYKVAEVNALIAEGADLRFWDKLLPFYAGFNYYYFLDDFGKSFTYLKLASERYNGSPYLDSLAALMAKKANKTKIAIQYLEHQINASKDREITRKMLFKRLQSLKAVDQIDQAISVFQDKYARIPREISELTARGVINSLPVDPYGGTFYIDDKGQVKATSDK